ncbi:MAG: hypothetical protein HUJ65_00035, partial [Oscillospiraceae bacterium]|nr:hypothetical protein [Oscillospiraceae bacterium]
MFGYIRPLRDELKVREYDMFRSLYCALCHTLKDEYGLASSFILNFEFVYLAMLLWESDEKPEFEQRRCLASPCRKKRCCKASSALTRAAGCSVILAWWKMRDTISDSGFIKSLGARLACTSLRHAYRKASSDFPEFSENTGRLLSELSDLEKVGCASLDEAADKFALILAAAADDTGDNVKRRILRELLYHTGRWIYIIDALDDLTDDVRSGSFNPIKECFTLKDDRLEDDGLAAVTATLTHSCNICG